MKNLCTCRLFSHRIKLSTVFHFAFFAGRILHHRYKRNPSDSMKRGKLQRNTGKLQCILVCIELERREAKQREEEGRERENPHFLVPILFAALPQAATRPQRKPQSYTGYRPQEG